MHRTKCLRNAPVDAPAHATARADLDFSNQNTFSAPDILLNKHEIWMRKWMAIDRIKDLSNSKYHIYCLIYLLSNILVNSHPVFLSFLNLLLLMMCCGAKTSCVMVAESRVLLSRCIGRDVAKHFAAFVRESKSSAVSKVPLSSYRTVNRLR